MVAAKITFATSTIIVILDYYVYYAQYSNTTTILDPFNTDGVIGAACYGIA